MNHSTISNQDLVLNQNILGVIFSIGFCKTPYQVCSLFHLCAYSELLFLSAYINFVLGFISSFVSVRIVMEHSTGIKNSEIILQCVIWLCELFIFYKRS